MMKTAFSARSARNISRLLAVFLLTVSITPVYAFAGGGRAGGGTRTGFGGGGRPDMGARQDFNANRNVNANVNHNVNANVNRNVNVDVNRNVNVNVNNRGAYYGGYHGPSVAGVVAAGVATAVVVGAIVSTLPPNCNTVVVNGYTYQNCGGTWYQQQYQGSNVNYVVVNQP